MSKRIGALLAPVAMSLVLALAGCAGSSTSGSGGSSGSSGAGTSGAGAKEASGQSLYTRLGGEKAITAVVDDFVPRAASDPKVNFVRKGTPKEWQPTAENVARLKKGLVQFIGMATGGPMKYEGRDMKSLHAGMKITNAEFDALAADLKASLVKLNVPAKERDELLGVVASTRKDIVE